MAERNWEGGVWNCETHDVLRTGYHITARVDQQVERTILSLVPRPCGTEVHQSETDGLMDPTFFTSGSNEKVFKRCNDSEHER